jgi:heterogeneous nuclear rnp K-like protein
MSASPSQPTQSAKRPLEETSSPSRNDQPDAKRPALDKVMRNDEEEILKPEGNGVPASEEPEKTNGVKADSQVETAAAEPGETRPIASAIGGVPQTSSTTTGSHDETAWIHIRAVISSPEAATIIGKGGENVSNIRKMSGAKCTVSDYQKGAVERILTVSGNVDAVAKVCFLSMVLWHRSSLTENRRRLASSSEHSIMKPCRNPPTGSPRRTPFDC